MSRALVTIDTGIRFMTQRQCTASNPALAATRAPLVIGLWSVLTLTVIGIIWGALAPIDSAVIARGDVMLLSSKKTIQHLEGGIIRAILVKDGDTVTAGQPLLRLEDTAASASRDTLQEQLYVARLTEARLIAERDKQDKIDFDKDLIDGSSHDPELAKAMAAQVHLFESEEVAEKAKLDAMRQRIAQSGEEIEGLKAQVAGAAGQLKLLGEEINTTQTLLAKGYATKTHLFDLQRDQSQLQGERGQYEAQIAQAEQGITETQMNILNQQKEFEAKNAQELRDAQSQFADLQDKLRATTDVVDRTLVTAPTSGIVNDLRYHTVGGVIAAGAPIMDIIPQNDQMIIEAHIKPGDIAMVHAGLDAKVVFTAYNMRTTPKIPAKVTLVSADTLSDNRMPGPPYYIARLEVDKSFLQRLSEHVELYPGMPAEVLIPTGSRSFLGYLFQPITDSMRRAFREE